MRKKKTSEKRGREKRGGERIINPKDNRGEDQGR